MKTIDRNYPPLPSELKEFINKIDFILPTGFLDFFRESNGANITSKNYTLLWTLTEMIELNKEYDVEEYAPEFFLFGSDGGDIAFGI